VSSELTGRGIVAIEDKSSCIAALGYVVGQTNRDQAT
jgi:hypothetical protein